MKWVTRRHDWGHGRGSKADLISIQQGSNHSGNNQSGKNNDALGLLFTSANLIPTASAIVIKTTKVTTANEINGFFLKPDIFVDSQSVSPRGWIITFSCNASGRGPPYDGSGRGPP